MRAAVSRLAGPPESVTVENVPVPLPGPHEVQVRVHAAAVNFPDVLFVADSYQMSLPRPFTPGSEFTGEVTALGTGVTAVQLGDRVVGTTMVGAFAELVVVAESALVPLPLHIDSRAASGFLVAYTTAYHALRTTAHVRKGEVVLVLGAAGGVGLAAVQLAVQMGARVIAAASTPEKLARCHASGADVLVNYGQDDFRGQLRAVAPGGVHVVIDPVGGTLSEQALRSCASGSRFVTVGYASGSIPAIPLNLVLLKGVTIKGFDLRAFTEAEPEVVRQGRTELLSILAAGALHPEVSRCFPLAEAAAALRYVADRKAVGKVVIDVATA